MLFNQYFVPKNKTQPLHKIKGTNPSSLPPCSPEQREKNKCTNLVTSIRKNALLPKPMHYKRVGHGWFLENGCYAIKWYEGQPVPNMPNNLCSHIDHIVHEPGPPKGAHWYHKKVQIIVMIFDNVYVCTTYFCMIAVCM